MGEFFQDLFANFYQLFTWIREVQLIGNMQKAGWAPSSCAIRSRRPTTRKP